MARLNESAAASTESIETLKRKFMRQNRDIARANSTQSLRIRSLENETSRLLAENLGLREQILRLQSELENGKAQRIADNARATKSQLEEKLLELGALINSLGDEQVRKENSPQIGKVARTSPDRSPNQRDWRNMCTLSEAVAAQEGRLPPILENKLYPRRTLERQEIADIISDAAADTTDSPEIGPPPISQFVDLDPVKIDLAFRPRKLDNEELVGLSPALSVNLEQRKKRRDSLGGPESKKVSKVEPIQDNYESAGSLKAGAKRKFSVRDDEEREVDAKQADVSPDEFKFTRVASEERSRNKAAPSQPEKSGNKVTREVAIAKGAPEDKQSTAPISRKVLAPKSVNNSPRKSSRVMMSDDIKASKVDAAKANPAKERSRERREETVSIKAPAEPIIETAEVQVEPETPAGLDIISPSSSQPSTARAESRDTPPPSDLGSGTESQRPSRRARGSVSYAEPNLRDKMRRPTKELVDAVIIDAKPHRMSAVKLEGESASKAVKVKPEPETDDEWKRMPLASSSTVENSPLSGKASTAGELPSSITTHRKRRESILHQAETELSPSDSGSVIAALVADRRKAKAEAKEKELRGKESTAKSSENPNIYESKDPLPAPAEEVPAKEVPTKRKGEMRTSRVSRRHTSVPRDLAHGDDSEASDIEASKKGRRQPTLGSRSSTARTEAGKEGDGAKTLKKATSAAPITEPEATGSRRERIAERRRSMML